MMDGNNQSALLNEFDVWQDEDLPFGVCNSFGIEAGRSQRKEECHDLRLLL